MKSLPSARACLPHLPSARTCRLRPLQHLTPSLLLGEPGSGCISRRAQPGSAPRRRARGWPRDPSPRLPSPARCLPRVAAPRPRAPRHPAGSPARSSSPGGLPTWLTSRPERSGGGRGRRACGSPAGRSLLRPGPLDSGGRSSGSGGGDGARSGPGAAPAVNVPGAAGSRRFPARHAQRARPRRRGREGARARAGERARAEGGRAGGQAGGWAGLPGGRGGGAGLPPREGEGRRPGALPRVRAPPPGLCGAPGAEAEARLHATGSCSAPRLDAAPT